ncbi:hypothetical protein DFS34DRAFT_594361 [Phlyctochytrium arcticum]|nr:hypothetical protein DFS34DRAFT_594361 [Phlyctochytrium arcticum]
MENEDSKDTDEQVVYEGSPSTSTAAKESAELKTKKAAWVATRSTLKNAIAAGGIQIIQGVDLLAALRKLQREFLKKTTPPTLQEIEAYLAVRICLIFPEIKPAAYSALFTEDEWEDIRAYFKKRQLTAPVPQCHLFHLSSTCSTASQQTNHSTQQLMKTMPETSEGPHAW